MPTKDNLGKKGLFHLEDYIPSLKDIRGWTQIRNLEAGTEAEIIEERCFLVCCPELLSLLSYTPQRHLPRGTPPTMGFDPPHQSLINISPRACSQTILRKLFFQLRFLSLSWQLISCPLGTHVQLLKYSVPSSSPQDVMSNINSTTENFSNFKNTTILKTPTFWKFTLFKINQSFSTVDSFKIRSKLSAFLLQEGQTRAQSQPDQSKARVWLCQPFSLMLSWAPQGSSSFPALHPPCRAHTAIS